MRWEREFEQVPPEVAAGLILDFNISKIAQDDDGTYTVAATAEGDCFVYGTHHPKRGWTPTPGLENQPTPPQVEAEGAPVCAVCNGDKRHRELYLTGPAAEPFIGSITRQPYTGEPSGVSVWLGSTCYPSGYSSFARMVGNSDPFHETLKEWKSGALTGSRWPVLRIVAEGMYQLAQDGAYVSAYAGGDYSTAARVKRRLAAGDATPEVEGYYLPATMLLGWLAEQPAEGKMVQALQILAANPDGHVSYRRLGLLVWLPQMQRQALATFEDLWLGDPGVRLTRRVHVRDIKNTRVGYVVVAQDDETGAKVEWFTDSVKVKVGQEGEAVFTVKRHQKFRGAKTTLVNRVKFPG